MSTKSKVKRNRRIAVFGLICLVVNAIIFYYLGNVWGQILEKNSEKNIYEKKLSCLEENEEDLKSEVNKLQDPEYLAKYAREKYLYSSRNEYILNIK